MPRRAPARGNTDEPQQGQAPTGADPTGQDTAAAAGQDAPREAGAAFRSSLTEDEIDSILPNAVVAALNLGADFKAIFAEACYLWGIDPNPKKKPREILNYRTRSGDPDAVPPEAPAVTIVLGGGKKLTYPIDERTERVLREIFNAWVVVQGKKVERPLPPDLTLPRTAIDGLVPSGDHVYRGGYLRSGGKAEADRRAAVLATLRATGKLR